MLSVSQAEALILELVQPFQLPREGETIALTQAHSRVLASPVLSALDLPHWDSSAMDGYAVRYADIKTASADRPVTLTLVADIPAGIRPTTPLLTGQAARVLTGAMMPAGSDTVVIQEEVDRQNDRIILSQPPAARSAHVRHRGTFHQAGQPLLMPGVRLRAAEIAGLAAVQCATVQVYRPARVAILSTGNELVTIDQPLNPGQIVDSNQYALTNLVQQAGAVCVGNTIVPDDPDILHRAISHAATQADVILSSGGVSVGDYDYVEPVLLGLGATIALSAVAIKPGKPLTVATLPAGENGERSCLYFGLPGNPASAMVTFWRFVQPALRKLAGESGNYLPIFISAKTRTLLKAGGTRETYLWGKLHANSSQEYPEFELPAGGHSSGNLVSLMQTNALAVIPVGQTQVPAQGIVRVMLLGS